MQVCASILKDVILWVPKLSISLVQLLVARLYSKYKDFFSLRMVTVFMRVSKMNGEEAHLNTIYWGQFVWKNTSFKLLCAEVVSSMFKSQLALKEEENIISFMEN